MVPVLEAVPNFSAGRDAALLERLVGVVVEAGAEVLDVSADPDHNRAVLTYVGDPPSVEEAAVRAARLAREAIDLREHRGAHPRIGALDVLPFVPLRGLSMDDARASARRVAGRIAREVGVPVYLYGEASEPRGRKLSELRRGGFESLLDELPMERRPDFVPEGWTHPGIHPSAGAVCVGARPLLLAWNVEVDGLDPDDLRRLTAELREGDGGFPGLRTLALILGGSARMQISMNLEDVQNRSPLSIFEAIEARVEERGGRVLHTEVVGVLPDQLILEAGADRLGLLEAEGRRVLSQRLVDHVDRRVERALDELERALRALGEGVPLEVRDAVATIGNALGSPAMGASDHD